MIRAITMHGPCKNVATDLGKRRWDLVESCRLRHKQDQLVPGLQHPSTPRHATRNQQPHACNIRFKPSGVTSRLDECGCPVSIAAAKVARVGTIAAKVARVDTIAAEFA
jgi:hypothetical protein